MIPSSKYPAKILLFGEYSILNGSEAIAFPYEKFSGTLKYDCISGMATSDPQKSQKPLIRLYQYLEQNLHVFDVGEEPHIQRLRNDLISGLYFDSNIPENYGLGSSGAITAAVYDSYCNQTEQKPVDQVIKTLAKIESFYHVYSSGIDPLVSFTRQTIHVVNRVPGISDASLDWVRSVLQVYLIDSGQKGATKDGMEGQTQRVDDPDYLSINNRIVRKIIRRQDVDLDQDIRALSSRQLSLFAKLFTPAILELARAGESGQKWAIKLCGSGGGGYYLLFSFSPDTRDALEQSGLHYAEL